MATSPTAPDSLAVFAHLANSEQSRPRHDFVPAGLLKQDAYVEQFGYDKHYLERPDVVEVDPSHCP